MIFIKSTIWPKEMPLCLINNYRPLVHTLESYTFDVKEMIENQMKGEMTKEELFSTLKALYKDVTIAERHYKDAMAYTNKGIVKQQEGISNDDFLELSQAIVSANSFTRRTIKDILKKVYKTKLNSILDEYDKISYIEMITKSEAQPEVQRIRNMIEDIYKIADIEVEENRMDYCYNPIVNLEPLFRLL